MRLAINIIRKEWFEYRKPILLLTAGIFVPLFVPVRSEDFRKGFMSAIIITAAYTYAYSCFFIERQRGTLQILLSLPVRAFDLVLAKYAALYTMALFTANVPGIFLRDLRLLFMINCLVVFFATMCMALTVIIDKPWAHLVPMWMMMVVFLPIQRILERFYPQGIGAVRMLGEHLILISALALALAPWIAVFSAYWFQRSQEV